MKKVVSIYTIEQLKELITYLDMPMLMVKGLSLNYKDLDINDALAIIKENKKEVIISIDKMFTPNELEFVKEFLNDYKDKIDYFYITDLGVCHYASKLGLANRIIFDPKTMITNRLDLEIYLSKGYKAIGISSEITLEDTLNMVNNIENSVFIQVFGYRLMFYSKRHLISLYSQKNNEEYPKEDIYFRESTRNDYFPGFENDNGTAMYRSYMISLLDNKNELKDCFGYLESYHVSNDNMITILRAFDLDINEGKELLNSLKLNILDGFKYKDSVYQKEELKQ